MRHENREQKTEDEMSADETKEKKSLKIHKHSDTVNYKRFHLSQRLWWLLLLLFLLWQILCMHVYYMDWSVCTIQILFWLIYDTHARGYVTVLVGSLTSSFNILLNYSKPERSVWKERIIWQKQKQKNKEKKQKRKNIEIQMRKNMHEGMKNEYKPKER